MDHQSTSEAEQDDLLTILPDGDASREPIQVPTTSVRCLPQAPHSALIQRLVQAAPKLLPAFEALLSTAGATASSLSSALESVNASLALAALSDLRARAVKALEALHAHEGFAAAYPPLLPSLAAVALSLQPLAVAAVPVEPIQQTRVLESRHPYDNNTRETCEVRS
jgi:hypothetical protein